MTLVNQIKMLKLINGKNTIKLYDVYESENYVHLIMEHIEGEDLFSAIKKKLDFTERDARRIMKELLRIVQGLHDLKIIHRDIKPENIMI